ncbi:MAG: hypothetical protein COX81_03855 [Candidatus Magasanikbacteria bacterium CG_4_10_14_0_2_um_filter_37_12]|uniref:Septum formation initiator n=1 Tax=Candidatus Magasanikbacteria bacterium CG_4_10_14_0_2_um_filter_37_12 TaxID=1974637 RepID=A0A2M7V6N5_9BACT|nr:MAG: hypothetical protein COX81_03855 [Candidatus Magasanikbacteria bacterium CG_4_10_14_0_2_um_filter_37_12]
MPRNIDKNGFKRFFGSRLFLVIALVVTILVAFSYARAYYQDYTIRQEIQSLQDQVKKLEKKKIESLEILKYVMSPSFVEEKARTELNLKKPGENVIAFPQRDEGYITKNIVNNQDLSPEENLDNPAQWWYYFIH